MSATVAIYARQSFDRHGDELAVSRQVTACRKYAHEHGWTVAAEHIDNDRSATTGAPRPAFEALLDSRPQRILVWAVDRLVRVTKDLERVIELGVDVHAMKAGHLDLSNPAGRAVARTVTAWATFETEQKAERQRAANDQRAEAGLPYRCQRAFGYEADGVTIRPAEADELRTAASRVIRGDSLHSIALDLNGRGILTAPGNQWTQTTVKLALLSPRNHGQRRHRGEVIGDAVWPAILDPDTGAAVRAILTDPRRSRKGPPRRYLMSGIMSCGRCGEAIVGAVVKGKGPTYRCPTLHLSRLAEPVDEYVSAVIVARLTRPDAVGLFAIPDDDPERVHRLRTDRDAARARLDALAEAFGSGVIDQQALAAGSRRAREQIDQLDAEISAAIADPELAEVVTAEDVAQAFGRRPLDVRRRIIDTLVNVTLLPVGPGRRVFDPERSLRIEWKGEADV